MLLRQNDPAAGNIQTRMLVFATVLFFIPATVIYWKSWGNFERLIYIAGFFVLGFTILLSMDERVPAVLNKLFHFINEPPRSRSAASASLLFIIALIVILQYKDILKANWWVVDDHEIINFVGSDRKMGFNEFVPALIQTEVGQIGTSTRFRPVYYSLRLLESILWGDNPTLWFIARIIIMIFFSGLIWQMTVPLLGLFGAFLFTIYTISFGFWTDFIARLGPSETYAVISVITFAWVFIWIWHRSVHGQVSSKAWLLMGILLILNIGIKENLLVLTIPLIVLFIHAVIRKTLSKSAVVALVISIASSIFCAAVLLVGLQHSGGDYYANPVGISSRGSILFHSMLDLRAFTIVLPCVFYFLFWRYGKGIEKSIRVTLCAAVGLLCGLLCLFCSQMVFYNGNWPTGMRYDFPGFLYNPLLYLVLLWILKEGLVAIHGMNNGVSSYFQFNNIFLFFMIFINMSGFFKQAVTIDRYVENSNLFMQQIGELSVYLKTNPESPVVFDVSRPMDYEPLFSYARFLRSNGIENDFMVRWNGDLPAAYNTPLDLALVRQLYEFPLHGTSQFLPFEEKRLQNGKCISLQFSKTSDTLCRTFYAFSP
ncbi:MAG: hypothetical protein ACYC6C_14050 [Coriobacteriia bacterium]